MNTAKSRPTRSQTSIYVAKISIRERVLPTVKLVVIKPQASMRLHTGNRAERERERSHHHHLLEPRSVFCLYVLIIFAGIP